MTTNIGFPAQPHSDLMSRLIADLRAKSDTARQEAVTGLRADPAAALGGKLTELHDVDRALTLNAQYREITSLSQARAATIQAALGTLSEVSVDLQVKAQATLDSPLASASAAVATAARQGIGAIVSALNVSQAGRALFAGDAGAGPALADAGTIAVSATVILEAAPDAATAYADLVLAFDDPGGIFATTLYLGGTGDAPATEIAEGERLADAPRADTPALRQILRDMAALAAALDRTNAIPDDQRAALAERAIGGLRNGAEPLAALAASVGSAEERMADATKRRRRRSTRPTTRWRAAISSRQRPSSPPWRPNSRPPSLPRRASPTCRWRTSCAEARDRSPLSRMRQAPFPTIQRLAIALAAVLMAFVPPHAAGAPRIKDLVEIEGMRGNDLVGYGLVVGLAGTGDGIRNAPFTEEALANLLERLGVNVSGEAFRPKNVAAVIVTATLPPFARPGSRIDITVSAIGDAKSLLGGTLVMTPLNAADGEIYAVAQGPIIAGGISAEGEAATQQIGVPTAGSIPGGARVEREIGFDFSQMGSIRLALREPDFTTATRLEAAINSALGRPVARMGDAGTITLDLAAAGTGPAQLISQIENLRVEPANRARVVVDQRSGTIVLGENVTISRVAVAQGNLSIRVTERPLPSQPNPFAEGETLVLPRTDIEIAQNADDRLALVEGNVTLADLVQGLNVLGVGPRDMIDILKAIKAAGALHADLIVQ